MGLDASAYLPAAEVAKSYLEAINKGESGVPFFIQEKN
jgi:hypothetical protein